MHLEKELFKISHLVTKKDKAAAVQQGICSQATVSRYLNNNAADDDLATELLVFFKERIAQRMQKIA